ncbi:HEXXH motif-containing putative peptide modification protein [Phormidium tenue]|uniref:HEXXH motif domain-containing protein n=1 Tax=Phormidium tenue NIES-30 TaxID=549789 RepID=A0A1U7J1W6_9CYAN|nr:HEXXH motif-containing putative peptide modification protein [Phormidium tenue]MBD2233658.1 hypothetical protein [Phormidium tenue FACHB-1052]OKH46081.1 hypothetical protein NIES30_17410 [Phormidium tenue NIES-30]
MSILWERFIHLCSWQKSSDALAQLRAIHYSNAKRNLQTIVKLIEQDISLNASNLLERFEKLPPESKHRLQLAPDTHTQSVLCNPNNAAEYLHNAIEVEMRAIKRQHLRHSSPHIYRNAAVDYRLGSGPFVDLKGPDVLRPLPDIPGQAARLPSEAAQSVLIRLHHAYHSIGNVSKYAQALIDQTTLVIVCREDVSLPTCVAACSPIAIGRTVLRNPHRTEVDEEELAECLIHEAIHTAIDIAELESPMFLPATVSNVKLISPWSGRSLDINTYLQACWVWFGLASFWADALVSQAFDMKKSFFRLNRALRGFTTDISVPLVPMYEVLNSTMLCSLKSSQQLAQELLTTYNLSGAEKF